MSRENQEGKESGLLETKGGGGRAALFFKMAGLFCNTCLNLKGIISVLKILSNTDRSKAVDLLSNVATTNNFDELLVLNLHLLWQELESNESLANFGELKTYFCGYFDEKSSSKMNEEALNCAEIDGTSVLNKCKDNECSSNLSEKRKTNNSKTIRWIFCQVCLQTLRCLKNTLQAMKSSDKDAKGPAVDLSISDQQIVKTVIQLIVVLGVCPNLAQGVGIPIEQRTGFSAALGTGLNADCPKCLYECVMTLVSCLSEPSLSLVILSKHLADILAALMQLGYCGEICDKRTSCVEQLPSQDKMVDRRLVDLSQGNCAPNSTDQATIADQGVSQLTDQDNLIIGKESTGQGNCVSKSEEQGKISEELSRVSLGPKDTQLNETGCEESAISMSICGGGILISKAQQGECKRALNNIMNKMYQPLIIRELLFLQGSMSGQQANLKESNTTKLASADTKEKSTMKAGAQKESKNGGGVKGKAVTRTPKWMKDVCGHLLSRCLTKKNGVQSVLRAVLEGASGWY